VARSVKRFCTFWGMHHASVVAIVTCLKEETGSLRRRRVMPMPFPLLAILGMLAVLVVVLAGFFLTRRWL
jgi:hypothetical protein